VYGDGKSASCLFYGLRREGERRERGNSTMQRRVYRTRPILSMGQ
jgi:hypothetical protein